MNRLDIKEALKIGLTINERGRSQPRVPDSRMETASSIEKRQSNTKQSQKIRYQQQFLNSLARAFDRKRSLGFCSQSIWGWAFRLF